MLELGGSDPFVVMPSADVDKAAQTAVTARVQNNGQSCIAAKRFIVHDDVADAFEELFVARMQSLRVGDPMDEQTDIGPLANEQGVLDVEAYVADAVAGGRTRFCAAAGGSTGPGWFYPPTVVTDITPAMRMYHEEVFGPVAQLFRVARRRRGRSRWPTRRCSGSDRTSGRRDADEQERFVARARRRGGVRQRHDHVVSGAPVRRGRRNPGSAASSRRRASARSAT